MTNTESLRTAWHSAQDALNDAVDAYGYDDPRTIAAERFEANALAAYFESEEV